MNINELVAIDVHTAPEMSCHEPDDDYRQFEDAKRKYFKSGSPPTIERPLPITANAE